MRNLRVEDTYFPTINQLRLKDKLFDLSKPKIMGIINCTPDSFYSESQIQSEKSLLVHVEKQIREGVDIIDIGGYSSRPGAKEISIKEEIHRVLPAITLIRKEFPEIYLSLDTFRSEVASIGLENGINIINDISGWGIDNELFKVLDKYKCPYILMHMKGTPSTMQFETNYDNLFNSISSYFSKKLSELKSIGVNDVILDPGFGFSKTLEQNHTLLHQMNQFKILGKPLLAGVSRKSMIYKKLNIEPSEALNGTSILNTIAILKGASILRVHDVKEAKEVLEMLDF